MRPFFCYYGGKFRAAPRYPSPMYETVIEPFAGAAGYSIRYGPGRVVLVEKDEKVAATWRYLLSVTPAEILALPDLDPGQTTDDLSLPQEARWLIGWWLNKGASSPRKSPSAWMRSGIRPNSMWGRAVRERIASQLSGLVGWEIIEGDYTEAPDIEATWFIDPAYMDAGKHYRHGSSGLDYSLLAGWCRSRRGHVIVCENEGATWLPFEPFITIKANESKSGGKRSREAIWTQSCARQL